MPLCLTRNGAKSDLTKRLALMSSNSQGFKLISLAS